MSNDHLRYRVTREGIRESDIPEQPQNIEPAQPVTTEVSRREFLRNLIPSFGKKLTELTRETNVAIHKETSPKK